MLYIFKSELIYESTFILHSGEHTMALWKLIVGDNLWTDCNVISVEYLNGTILYVFFWAIETANIKDDEVEMMI